MNRSFQIATLSASLMFGLLANAQRQTVINSEHDLSNGSADGPSSCFYCHVPHHANPSLGLWGHQVPPSSYDLGYQSSTYTEGSASISSPSPSRLCLSCHDGTIGLGAENNSVDPYPTSRTLSQPGTNMGINLRADHPQSFGNWVKNTINPNLETMHDSLYTTNATGNGAVALWRGRIECTTCHDPHTPNNDLRRPSKFLSLDNTNGNLCKVCHDVTKNSPNVLSGWTASAHNLSQSTEGSATTGYQNVAQGACMNCHVPHRSGAARLLRNQEGQNCFTCHADSTNNSQPRWAQVWVGNTDTTKFMHPVQATGHQPVEDLSAATTARHSECWDCHDAHAMKTSGTSTSPLQAELMAATGIDQFKNPSIPAQYTYEVCFKCHADSANKPQGTVANYAQYGYTPLRQVPSHNTRLDFTSSISRHNVVQQRRTAGITPADRPNILKLDNNAGRDLTSGYITCEDCHSGNNPANDGGTGPNGPHISTNQHILERPYEMNLPPTVAGASVLSLSVPPDGGDPYNGPFALCNKCHDVAGLLGGTLPGPGLSQVPGPKDNIFKHHNTHVVQGGISCAVCHAPHGVTAVIHSSTHTRSI